MDIRKLVAAAAALCLCAGAVITPAYVGRVGAMAEETAGATPEAAGEIDLSEINERFHGLMEVNTHTVGWLKVNEYIDYPVVQYDNEYYLHTDFYGDRLSDSEIETLISTMLETGASPTCPHGRPVSRTLSRREIEKLFKRIQ